MVVASRQRIRSESQDWRDLATSRQPGLAPAEAPAAAAAANTKFDTLGWASFDSPKQEQQPQQPVTAGTPAAAAGLFWERFGGDGDGEAEPGAPESAPTAPAKPLVPVPQTRAPASASAPATCAAPRPVSPPPPPPHAAAGPLSAGMGQLQHRLPGSSSAVNSDPGEAPTSVYLSGGSGADLPLLGGSASEVEQLRSTVTQLQEHAQVLESLLENRNTETADLRAEVDRLRRQLAAAQALIGVQQQQQQQQQPLGGSRHINPPIPGLAITPPGAVDLATSSRSAVDAPTPTFPGARPQNGGVPRPTGGYATSAPNTCRQATATLPGTEELRNRLGGMGLSSHPVAFTPGSAINSSSGGSAGTINTVLPPSLQRFSQTSHSGSTRPPSTSSGQSTPSQPGSPMRQRASSGGGGGGAGRPPSPTKVPHHARTFSAPNSLFADLDPLK